MSEFMAVKFFHVILFAYWLGTDLAVYYSSYYVSDPARSPEVRVVIAKLLFALDQVVRCCMTLALPSGLHLMWRLGLLPVTGFVMGLIWLTGIGWLVMVITLHRLADSPFKTGLARFDFGFRLLLIALLGVIAFAGLPNGVDLPYWIVAKLAIFALLITCGLIIRLKLRGFGPAFGRLIAGDADVSVNDAIRTSLAGTRPFVIIIWTGVLASAALGLHVI